MITVEQFESGEVELINEWFEPVYINNYTEWGIPFKKLVGFKGVETDTLLHPDFDDILESYRD